ncbi:F0F1 ATP synthase subunit A [Burkholderiaceae bacterium FT117]|uniref:F0F1 ATP synthase subunit A n=1 Tax=Zeimonas sediminis TaxID=2944268 RepID=UPI00234321E0|nr:F0F1 ATP synthase subunit A [Zeimonas sediminis]MCM5569439.1 F0F1 ATP synthase subunit A [Zeimonas sediminis]
METIPVLFSIGPLAVTRTVVTTWVLIALFGIAAALSTRRLSVDPGPLQTAVEGIVVTIDEAIGVLLPDRPETLLPFVGTLWLFIGVANLSGLVPGVAAPTGDLSTTAALAVLVFLSVHWFGIRSSGLREYLSHYLRPNPVMLPFHIVSEISRTVALAVRLFGNVMSLETAALLVLLVAGLVAPVPVLMLHVVEAVVQAYIFGMLALVYITGGIHSQRELRQKRSGETT